MTSEPITREQPPTPPPVPIEPVAVGKYATVEEMIRDLSDDPEPILRGIAELKAAQPTPPREAFDIRALMFIKKCRSMESNWEYTHTVTDLLNAAAELSANWPGVGALLGEVLDRAGIVVKADERNTEPDDWWRRQAVALAKAILDAGQTDDGEVVTEEWLRSIGAYGKGLDDWDGLVIHHKNADGYRLSVKFEIVSDTLRVLVGCVEVFRSPNRGDVRQLLSALGIPPRGNSEGG